MSIESSIAGREEARASVFALDTPRRVHLVGIGGVGMSAIATVLSEMGHKVSGSDLKDSASLDRLRSLGATVTVGHHPANVGDAQAVAISSAIRASNPEVMAATDSGIPVLSRADLLASIVATRRTLAVAGTHGKTTTTSMLSLALVEAGWRPSYLVGGELNEIGGGAAWEDGGWLVVEADESDGTFLELLPEVAVVTNVEADHLDYYGSFEALKEAFRRYISTAPCAVVWTDDPVAAQLAERGAVTVGRSDGARYRVVDENRSRAGSLFRLLKDGAEMGQVVLAVPGAYNVANAAVAAAAASEIGVPFDFIASALARFGGVARRFQFGPSPAGVQIVEDYAHLPGEVRPVLEAARECGWQRVVAVFQPHRYSRTELLWESFGEAFAAADVVVVTDVYSAGEAARPGVTGRLVAEAVRRREPSKEVHYVPSRAELAGRVADLVRPGDVCMLLGAGDVGGLSEELAARLG